MSCCKYCPCNPSAIQSGNCFENCVCSMGLRTPVMAQPKPSALCNFRLPPMDVGCDPNYGRQLKQVSLIGGKVLIVDDPGYHPTPGGIRSMLPIRFMRQPLELPFIPRPYLQPVYDTYDYFINAVTRYS